MEGLDSFRRRLESHFPRLTKSEQKIASYLLTDLDQAAFLTASELANHLDVSEATVVRFAKSIGYDSFPKLRRSIQEMYRVKATPATRLQRKLADLQDKEEHVLSQIIDMELQYLSEVLHSVKTTDFDRAVKIVANAQRIFVFGQGASRFLADLVEFRLRRFGMNAHSVTESGRDIVEKLLLLQRGDVVIANVFHRITGEGVAMLERARAVGCQVVLLTDILEPGFKDKADVILTARRGPVSTFHSLTVPMAILNAMILAIAMTKTDETLSSLKQLDELRAAFGLDIVGKLKS
jgi:DNA-binding MurR/RpiR family transcriptional regulator